MIFFRFLSSLDRRNRETDEWIVATVELPTFATLFVIEGIRGGLTITRDQGDIAVDTFFVNSGDCCD